MNKETKDKQVKKYPKPEEQETIDKIMDLANQWCNMDKNGGRGAMVMLTDERGTHFLFLGSKDMNIKCATSLKVCNDFESAGRLVQIVFQQAEILKRLNEIAEGAGVYADTAEDVEKNEDKLWNIPEFRTLAIMKNELDKEARKIWQEK